MSLGRREFLGAAAAGFVLTPLSALLSACGRASMPEGMVEIKWDRDTCVRCNMALSDRRFAAQARGGPKDANFKFDDIGCAMFWLKEQAWGSDAATRLWVADVASRGEAVQWLDAKKAWYVGGKTSPMGYNYGATAAPQAGALEFADMRTHVLAKGR